MKKSNVIESIKEAATIAVGFGVTIIVGNVVKFTTPTSLNIVKKGLVGIGTLALSGMLSEKASEYVGKVMDTTVQMVKDMLEDDDKEEEDEI